MPPGWNSSDSLANFRTNLAANPTNLKFHRDIQPDSSGPVLARSDLRLARMSRRVVLPFPRHNTAQQGGTEDGREKAPQPRRATQGVAEGAKHPPRGLGVASR